MSNPYDLNGKLQMRLKLCSKNDNNLQLAKKTACASRHNRTTKSATAAQHAVLTQKWHSNKSWNGRLFSNVCQTGGVPC